MIKKTITFENFNEEEVTKDFHFNLTKLEIAEMELRYSGEGSMVDHLQKIVDAKDNREIYDTFKDIVRSAVGEKSADGMRFIKNDDIRSDLMDSNAIGELFLDLMGEDQPESSMADFFNQMIPREFKEKIEENAKLEGETKTDNLRDQ